MFPSVLSPMPRVMTNGDCDKHIQAAASTSVCECGQRDCVGPTSVPGTDESGGHGLRLDKLVRARWEMEGTKQRR